MIDRANTSEMLVRARNIAGEYLERRFHKLNENKTEQYDQFIWVKPEFTSPSFEHITFGYKNAVFPVLVDILIDGRSTLPEKKRCLLCDESLKHNLTPCLFEVVRRQLKPSDDGLFNGIAGQSAYNLQPASDGWNLKHARTGELLDPTDFGSDMDTPMSKWELRNFAIGVVRKHGLKDAGFVMDSFCDIPEIDPQMWFHDREGKRSWAIVRYQSSYNESAADEFRDFVKENPHLAPYDGYFAAVSAAMADAVIRDQNGEVISLSRRFDGSMPLYRGHKMYINFRRMIPIYKAP